MKKILLAFLGVALANSSFAALSNCVFGTGIDAVVALNALNNINDFGVGAQNFTQIAPPLSCHFSNHDTLELSPFQNVGDLAPQISVHENYAPGQTSEVVLTAQGHGQCNNITEEVNVPAHLRASIEAHARAVCAGFVNAAGIN